MQIRIGLLVLGAVLFAREARADFTVHSSVGGAFWVSGTEATRQPVNFDIAPGWDFARLLRVEIPIVFALGSGADDEGEIYPLTPNAFLGIRPQAKIFPLDWLYGKVALQFFFPGGDIDEMVEQDFYFGTTFGVGFEWVFFDFVGVSAEVNVSPLFTPDTTIPIELRGGVTLLF